MHPRFCCVGAEEQIRAPDSLSSETLSNPVKSGHITLLPGVPVAGLVQCGPSQSPNVEDPMCNAMPILGVDKNVYVEPIVWTTEWAQRYYKYPVTRSN